MYNYEQFSGGICIHNLNIIYHRKKTVFLKIFATILKHLLSCLYVCAFFISEKVKLNLSFCCVVVHRYHIK